MPRPARLPAPLALVPFHVREAFALGVEPSRLRRDDLAAPFRGVRSTTRLESIAEVCAAYLPLLRDDQCFSHTSAAALWGMWLPARLEAVPVIHVMSVGASREPRMRGVVGHRVAPGSVELTMRDGLPVTAPAETWRQLAAELALDELIEAGDSLVRRKSPLVSLEELGASIARHAGRRGVVNLTRALPHVRAGTDSPRETRVRLLLIRAGLPEPAVNPVVSRPEAPITRYGDMVYPEFKVIVEYDGRHHRDSARQYAADVLRLEQLAREGWTVVRVLAQHFEHPHEIVARVMRALQDHGWRPSRSSLQKLRRFRESSSFVESRRGQVT